MEILTATDSNFDEIIASNDKVLVKYHAGWCGSCRLMAPKYKKLANDKSLQNITFIEVDAENNKEARSKANVNNLPFFAAFSKGELVEGFSSAKIEAVEEMAKNL